jgi:3-hydroxyisobutyrate dehydrogenase-like beta-hydroxyacid dehydrogenase
MIEIEDLASAAADADGIVSICPPAAAEAVARAVMDVGFSGIYIDANAISPVRSARIEGLVDGRGARFVDGSVIGGPAWKPGETWLYLAGEHAETAATWFAGGPLETQVLGRQAGQASAIKMCYAAFTKGSTALLCAILGAADALDVLDPLIDHWAREGSGLDQRSQNSARRVTAKAWRFAGEMLEISETFQTAGQPGEFHQAAAQIFERLADFKDSPETPELSEVLDALSRKPT